jgi:hypothetical protein
MANPTSRRRGSRSVEPLDEALLNDPLSDDLPARDVAASHGAGDTLRDEDALDDAGSPALGWSAAERVLLARMREQRAQDTVPEAARQRLLSVAIEEAGRERRRRVAPAGQLVPVQPRTLTRALAGAAALMIGLVLLTHVRGVLDLARGTGSASAGSTFGANETSDGKRTSAATGASLGVSERLLGTALFHGPAQTLEASEVPPASANLFPERPFSDGSRAWQVRRWDNLGAAPLELARHEFVRGDLCVTLAQSQRVLGAWPWAPASVPAPSELPLAAGHRYRLVFRAWARDPLPAQLLVAVGHARAPFSAAAGARVPVAIEPRWFAVDFVPPHDDPSAGVAFLATSSDDAESTRVCVGDVMLTERP